MTKTISKDDPHQHPTTKEIAIFDLVKFVCAFFVVAIHTFPPETQHLADFYVLHVIVRVAVPLFFAMSSYLLFGKMTFGEQQLENSRTNRKRLYRQVKRIVFLYLFWSAVYIIARLPMWYRMNWWGLPLLQDLLRPLFLSGTYFHLWYLLSLIYALPCLYFLLCKLNPKALFAFCIIAWVFQCIGYSYYFLCEEAFPQFLTFVESFSGPWDALTRATPLMAIGILCAKEKRHITTPLLPICALVLCAAEASLLYYFTVNRVSFSCLLSTPLLAYCTLSFLLSRTFTLSKNLCALFRNTSLTIYCLHLLIRDFLLPSLPNGFLRFTLVSLITTAIAVGVHFLGIVRKKHSSKK